jgi:hypothetical protein
MRAFHSSRLFEQIRRFKTVAIVHLEAALLAALSTVKLRRIPERADLHDYLLLALIQNANHVRDSWSQVDSPNIQSILRTDSILRRILYHLTIIL